MNNQNELKPKKLQSQQNYEDDYEPEQQNGQLRVTVQQKQPLQQYVSLFSKQIAHQRSLDKQDYTSHERPTEINNAQDHIQPKEQIQQKQTSVSQNNIQQKTKLIAKLKDILHSKIEQIKDTKKRIGNSRKEIKDIGDQVDKEMNKSIAKHSKPHNNIDIQSIFQSSKANDPQINQLNIQLAKIRAEVKRVKSQIKSIQNQVNGPVNMINLERATQFRLKIKQLQQQIKSNKQQKQFIELQMKLMDSTQLGYQIDSNDQINQNKTKNQQLLNEMKYQKNQLYQLQKQDRVLTQKIKYIEQLDSQVEVRKSRATVGSILSRQQYENNIKLLVEEIRQILDKRNKIQNQRKNTMKNLENQVSSIQAKNWQIINKLRQIDSKLLKHYNSKLKKKVQKQPPQQINKSQDKVYKKQKVTQNLDKTTKTAYATIKNDKNLSSPDLESEPPAMVQKKKNYQFFMQFTENQVFGNIVLSDEMLGNKLYLKRLNFILDQNTLYGLYAEYLNDNRNQVYGYKIMSKIKPKQIITKSLAIDETKGEVINLIHVGIDKNQNIKYLQIVTSQAKQFKWGSLQLCDKNEQKNIRKYENLVIKGKLNQISDKQAPNYYCLAGIGFCIIYLSPK